MKSLQRKKPLSRNRNPTVKLFKKKLFIYTQKQILHKNIISVAGKRDNKYVVIGDGCIYDLIEDIPRKQLKFSY